MGNVALGITIKTMRLSRNLSQQDLADKVGVSRSAVGMWENGEREPNLDTLESLANVFNVPLYSLVDSKSIPKPKPEQSEMLYVSMPSGNPSTDELRKYLHDVIDQFSDDDLQFLKDMTIRLRRD